MTKVVRLRLRADPEEEAAAWIARIDKGMAGDDEAKLREWLAADPRHVRAFRELSALWDEADNLAELAELFPLDRSVSSRAVPLRRYALAAAVFVAVAIAVFIVQRPGGPLSAPDTRIFTASLATPVGGRLTEELPDGSVVMLNTDTEVTVDYSPRSRTLRLGRGEAHFEVAADPSRAFDVHAGGRFVRAYGTAFNVRLGTEGRLEITVTEGEVRVATAGGADEAATARPSADEASASEEHGATPGTPRRETSLAEGQVAVLDPEDSGIEPRVFRLDPADLDIKLAWQRGMLIFRGEPLDEMLREVGRYTTTHFVLADSELAEVRVGGYFRAGDVDGLLVALRENLDIESERLDGDRIVLRVAD